MNLQSWTLACTWTQTWMGNKKAKWVAQAPCQTGSNAPTLVHGELIGCCSFGLPGPGFCTCKWVLCCGGSFLRVSYCWDQASKEKDLVVFCSIILRLWRTKRKSILLHCLTWCFTLEKRSACDYVPDWNVPEICHWHRCRFDADASTKSSLSQVRLPSFKSRNISSLSCATWPPRIAEAAYTKHLEGRSFFSAPFKKRRQWACRYSLFYPFYATTKVKRKKFQFNQSLSDQL